MKVKTRKRTSYTSPEFSSPEFGCLTGCLKLPLGKTWHNINWNKVQSDKNSQLPNQFQIVQVAYQPEGKDQIFATRAYWCETFFKDVCFTLELENGFFKYATTEILAWRVIP